MEDIPPVVILDEELFRRIAVFVTIKDFNVLMRVHSSWNRTMEDERFWEYIGKAMFPYRIPTDPERTWKELVKLEYRKEYYYFHEVERLHYRYFVCIKFLGRVSCGKSSLILRYTELVDEEPVKFGERPYDYVKYINSPFDQNDVVKLEIWDTDSSELIRPEYYEDCTAFIICYDITDMESFYDLDRWYDNICKYGKHKNILLLGCKSDLEDYRAVTKDEGIRWCRSKKTRWGIDFAECSSVDFVNVGDILKTFITKTIDMVLYGEPRTAIQENEKRMTRARSNSIQKLLEQNCEIL